MKLFLSKINALQTGDGILYPTRACYKAEPEKKQTIQRAKLSIEQRARSFSLPEKERTAKRQWHKIVLDRQKELRLRLNTIKSLKGMQYVHVVTCSWCDGY